MNEKALRLYNAITEIDEELIEAALKAPKQKRRKSVLKALLIAAIILALSFSALYGYAVVNNTDIPSIILQFKGEREAQINNFLEDLEHTQAKGYALDKSVFSKEMKKIGIFPVTMPAFFGNDDIILKDESNGTDEVSSFVKDAFMEFKTSEYSGFLSIEQYAQPPEENGVQTQGFMGVSNGRIVESNGMDILVLENFDDCQLYYRDKNTIYSITIYNVDFETGIKIAQSIE